MKRREFIKTTASSVVGLTFGLTTLAGDNQKKQSRPNILFIMTDQQHAGMMSCTGNKWLKTPALDRLAASGIRFEHVYACNPVCLPSRFSLQTGLMPSAIGVGRNEDGSRAALTGTMVEQTLGNLFQQAGYETVYGGKVHLPKQMNNSENIGYRNLTSNSRLPLAQACAEFLKGKHEKPFFLFASFMNPHDICFMGLNAYLRSVGKPIYRSLDSQTCEAVLDEARNSGDLAAFVLAHCPPLPANHGIPDREPECITRNYTEARPFRAYIRAHWDDDQWRLHRWVYCRLTEKVDAEIGIVLDALQEAKLEDKTLVVFTSDHGDMDSAHKMEHKSVLYEESVRIPFIMSYKGRIPAGAIDDAHLISNGLDLLPTLCDYAVIKTPEGLPGRSLRPLVEDKAVQWRHFVVTESQNGRMLRTQRYKYCIYDSGRHREQLIDMENDPGEMKNLAGDEEYKDVLVKHRWLLQDWIEKTGDKIGDEYIIAGQ